MSYQLPEGTIEVPDDWNDLTTHEFVDSREDGFKLEVVHNENEDGITPEAAISDARDRLETISGGDLEVLSETSEKISGLAARTIVMRDRSEQPYHMMKITVVRMPNGRLVTFTASAPTDVWDKYVAGVDEVVKSIRPSK